MNSDYRSIAMSSPSSLPYYSSNVTTSNNSISYDSEEERKAKEEKDLEMRRMSIIAPDLAPYY